MNRTRTFSTTSRANGSAYGYSSGYRQRIPSNLSISGRRGSLASIMARRRGSSATQQAAGPENMGNGTEATGGELNFAQRLLMANELAVTNIADLWVAAAMNVDNEDVFVSDSDDDFFDRTEDVFIEDEDLIEDDEHDPLADTPTRPGRLAGRSFTPLSHADPHAHAHTPSPRRPGAPGSRRPSGAPLRRFSTVQTTPPLRPQARGGLPLRLARTLSIDPGPAALEAGHGAHASRRPSATHAVPAIFTHTGVRTPPTVADPAHPPLHRHDSRESVLVAVDNGGDGVGAGEGLAPIIEGQASIQTQPALVQISEKKPSMFSQLPMMIIIQYGLLALHSTTHDQIFLSYLVSCVSILWSKLIKQADACFGG